MVAPPEGPPSLIHPFEQQANDKRPKKGEIIKGRGESRVDLHEINDKRSRRRLS